ncbi:hypothetical protein HYFRA_00001922 [Hymenoscyphus fraxineus]|uniref:Uncharacterized protein n=1 Tax=Hymenoscyphus fraxineus TaxID=746836 RepID=A0A9N9PMD0_9HELO|nr:hypothetical protein HYFRA_00001922 [Hymenoscyphus fraxineus]
MYAGASFTPSSHDVPVHFRNTPIKALLVGPRVSRGKLASSAVVFADHLLAPELNNWSINLPIGCRDAESMG